MLRKRIIFSLIYSDGIFMQSRNFRLQKVGDINWLEKNYKFNKIAFSIDELIVLNATKGKKEIVEFSEIVKRLVSGVFIPVAAGGGVRSIKDSEILFNNGADKIVLNSILYENPNEVELLIKKYGSQSIVASIDCKVNGNFYDVYINDGTKKIELSLFEYIHYIEKLGVGEIYLNSIDKDRTGFGYDEILINNVNNLINVPLIVAGGAGNENHLERGLGIDNVSAVATANLFNFIGDGLPIARTKLLDSGVNLPNWK
jgi:cyclase